jgi:hypothetical protein
MAFGRSTVGTNDEGGYAMAAINVIDIVQSIAVIGALSISAYETWARRREQRFHTYQVLSAEGGDLEKMLVVNPQLHALYDYSDKDIELDYDELPEADKACVMYCTCILSLCERVWVATREKQVATIEWPYWAAWLAQLWQSKHFRWTIEWVKDNFDREFMDEVQATRSKKTRP